MPAFSDILTVPLLGLVFMALVFIIARRFRLGLDRDIALGTLRTFVQLFAVGFLLSWLFQAQGTVWIVVPIVVMIMIAAHNARGKAGRLRGAFWRIAVALAASETVAMALLLGLNIVPATAPYVIPLSGMVIGNAMVVAGLFYNRLLAERRNREEMLLLLLSLGADRREAYRQIGMDAVKAAMVPSIDALKTVGLVQLPGMMTGMIVAGASPLEAVGYQILIMYAIAGAAAVTAIALYLLSLSLLFTPAHQFKALPAEVRRPRLSARKR
ncbi:MAG: iron export ABC transporter permease subunit FetB [Hydrogenibacillus sp.]|nr:iron export ABC transporter permease subunit FetB [Hydrogenibacillus sp.]